MRYRSPESILDEFEHLVKDWEVGFIKFSDDTFTVNKRRVIEFCEAKLRKGIKTQWGCNIRADTVDEEMLTIMRKARCREVWVGVESGSPPILHDMKKNITIEEIKRSFKKTAALGFLRRAYVLLGMPNEDYEDIRLTEELIDDIKPDSVGFTILAPYPGTEFYQPDIHSEVDWSVVDEYENHLTSTAYLSNEDLYREQQRLVKKYRDKLVFRHRKSSNKDDKLANNDVR